MPLPKSPFTVIQYPSLGGLGGGVQEILILSMPTCLTMRLVGACPA